MSAPHFGVALAAYDAEGFPVVDQVGELVVTRPMPSMPLYFWDDPDGTRYRDAYFSSYPGVRRHGDWITVTGHGSVIVHGRSGSTLNRNGVRLGNADIHDVVERLPEIAEALVIGGGGTRRQLLDAPVRCPRRRDAPERCPPRKDHGSDPHWRLIPPRPRRHPRSSRHPAHPYRQETRSPRQTAAPGSPGRAGRLPRRRGRPPT